MASDRIRSAGKTSLPFILASILCGYATNFIPSVFPPGELRDWAYRTIPLLSLCILFLIRVLSDIGTMSFNELIYCYFCANPEKKKLKIIMYDDDAEDDVKETARNRYNEIVRNEMDFSSHRLNYVLSWVKRTPPPQPPHLADEE
ncbi:hypothetical protein [Serratia fonticola]|uniref:hypothetical protein n=1 Tax=Serratia fonticola TaxID=47917 RepID=UPI003AAE8060